MPQGGLAGLIGRMPQQAQPQPIGTGPQPGMTFNQGSNGFGDFGGQPSQEPASQAMIDAQNARNAALPPNDSDFVYGVPPPLTLEQEQQIQKRRDQNLSLSDSLRMQGVPGFEGQPGQAPQGIAGLPQQPQQQQPQNIAQQYMNPYLQSVLTPQLEELRRQNEITNMGANAKLTGAGAYGGGRQAIMNAENNRNLMQEMNKTVGQGYASAYDKGMGQFNTEQGQFKDVINLIGNAGAQERGITSEGIAADKAEFEAQRQFPFQQAQYMRDMISGLPTGSVTNTPANLSGTGAFLSALGGGTAAASALGYKNVGDLLKSLGLDLGPKTPVDE